MKRIEVEFDVKTYNIAFIVCMLIMILGIGSSVAVLKSRYASLNSEMKNYEIQIESARDENKRLKEQILLGGKSFPISEYFKKSLILNDLTGNQLSKKEIFQSFSTIGAENVTLRPIDQRGYFTPFYPPLMIKYNDYHFEVTAGVEYPKFHKHIAEFEKLYPLAQISSFSLRIPDEGESFLTFPLELYGSCVVSLPYLESFHYHMR